MSHFIPFTEEELYKAAHTDIKQYLESVGEEVKKSGTEYMWVKHDSVKIRGHVFYQHSTGAKGTAVNFLMEFFNFSFQEAVITLIDGKYIAKCNTKPSEFIGKQIDEKNHHKDTVILPPKNANNNRLYAYLCNTRCISIDVAYFFVCKGLVYESANTHNMVFLGKDKYGNTRSAELKGTLSNKPFKGELPNGNKSYSFRCISSTSDILYVFEAVVDLMSYITLLLTDYDWQHYSYIALGGLSEKALNKTLNDYANIKKIIICTDNDYADTKNINHGQIFAEKVRTKYSKKGYITRIITPKSKDWNEQLKNMRRQ